jgi:hypothetical protein
MSTKLTMLKCPNWIKPRFTPKKKKRVADKRAAIYCGDYTTRFDSPIPDGFERCGGNLEVDLQVSNEPEWGGTCAALNVVLKCDSCGQAFLNPDHLMTDEAWAEMLIAEALDKRGNACYVN